MICTGVSRTGHRTCIYNLVCSFSQVGVNAPFDLVERLTRLSVPAELRLVPLAYNKWKERSRFVLSQLELKNCGLERRRGPYRRMFLHVRALTFVAKSRFAPG